MKNLPHIYRLLVIVMLFTTILSSCSPAVTQTTVPVVATPTMQATETPTPALTTAPTFTPTPTVTPEPGLAFAFTHYNPETGKIETYVRDSVGKEKIIAECSNPAWSPGNSVIVCDDELELVIVDMQSMEVTRTGVNGTQASFNSNGSKIAFQGESQYLSVAEIDVFNKTISRVKPVYTDAFAYHPIWSSDGNQIFFDAINPADWNAEPRIHSYDLSTKKVTQISHGWWNHDQEGWVARPRWLTDNIFWFVRWWDYLEMYSVKILDTNDSPLPEESNKDESINLIGAFRHPIIQEPWDETDWMAQATQPECGWNSSICLYVRMYEPYEQRGTVKSIWAIDSTGQTWALVVPEKEQDEFLTPSPASGDGIYYLP